MDWGNILSNSLIAAVGVQAVIYALAAIGLNVHFGYTGLLNFGQAGFLAVAAYGLAASVATWGLPLWVGMVVGPHRRRHPRAAARALRPCGCEPTTSPS